jgi:hypothetical protein
MTAIPLEDLQSVDCPTCGADPGVPCTIRRPGSGPAHIARGDAFLRAQGTLRRQQAAATPDLLAPLLGGPIPGGCDHCAASTTVTRTPTGRLVITTEHDTTCPRRTP